MIHFLNMRQSSFCQMKIFVSPCNHMPTNPLWLIQKFCKVGLRCFEIFRNTKKKHSFWPLLLQTKNFLYFWCWRVLYLSRTNFTLLEWILFRFLKKFRYHSVTRAGKGRKTGKHELKNEKVNIEQSSRCRRDLVWAS